MKKTEIKTFFDDLQMQKINKITIKDVVSILINNKEKIQNYFDTIPYIEKNNIYKIIANIAKQEIRTSSSLKDTLYWQIRLILKINDIKFWEVMNKEINFENYIEEYFDILYFLIQKKYIVPKLEFYIKIFNEKYGKFSDKIKEIFFILFLEKIALEYNIDKKIGYTRIHWNDIFNVTFKKNFLNALITTYNDTQTSKEIILNLLMVLDNFIYIYIDVFSELINKIQFLNIKNNLEYRNLIYDLLEDEEKITISDKEKILKILHEDKQNINFNYYIALFLLNLFTYKIYDQNSLKNFKKEMYSNHIDLEILTLRLENLPLIYYNEDYELIYLINLGAENKFIDIKNSINRLIELLNKKIKKEEPLFVLNIESIEKEIPGYEEWKNFQLLNKLKFLFDNYSVELKELNYKEYYEKFVYYLRLKSEND